MGIAVIQIKFSPFFKEAVRQWRAKTKGNVYPFRNGSQNVTRAFTICGTGREKVLVPKGVFHTKGLNLFSDVILKTSLNTLVN